MSPDEARKALLEILADLEARASERPDDRQQSKQ
jgi:hypothetical protein